MRLFLSLTTAAVLALLLALWAMGGVDAIGQWAAVQQRGFQNTIALALRAARAGESGAVIALLGACFAYGLAHAAGPGHGKVLIGGYGFGRAVPMLRLSVIALLASLGQAVTAVVLVYAGVLILNLGRDSMIGITEQIMAPVSYGAIALIGLWLLWRGLRRMMGRRETHTHSHNHNHDHGAEVCGHCGHAHGPTLEQVGKANDLRAALALIGGIAVRPCTGALFVLIITWQMGIGPLGVAGAFVMAFGTALITIAVGLAAAGLRGGLLAGLAGSTRLAQAASVVETLAGAVVFAIALTLLLRAL
ncbi:nickel/cobalt transporter [Sulfitobacter mediterraneus]|uniref:Nickel/cobalt efflux system n=1 Tax=Sulfitobacter mediterraneus TaxID=83219 RepID=A0A061SPF9_9RHOB|nr:membrane protein [Sulfitobacter mediterraneus]KAJ03596.1 membrane protein [Sulfitobacter mediterraneus]